MFATTLFDYNGVLVDDEHVHLAAFQDALAPLGISVSETDYWNKYLGFDDEGAFSAMLGDAGHSPSRTKIAELIENKKPLYLKRAERELKGFDGAAQLVKARAEVGPVVIVSGALREEIAMGLKVLGIEDCIDAIVAAEDTKLSKPDPEGYLLGLQELEKRLPSHRNSHTVVFEDSIDGITAAKKAELVCVAFAHSYPQAKLESTEADLVLNHIRDLDTKDLLSLYARTH